MDGYENFIKICPGKRSNGSYYKDIGTNYFFKISRKRGEKLYLKCIEAGCSAKLNMDLNSKVRRSYHNHDLNPEIERELEFVNRCKKRASETVLSFREIFDSEILR